MSVDVTEAIPNLGDRTGCVPTAGGRYAVFADPRVFRNPG
jgi:hypothetical protein